MDNAQQNPVIAGLDTPAGLTLRDWLAGQALAGFSRAREAEMFNDNTIQWYAQIAYEMADAMLAERNHESRKRPARRAEDVRPPAPLMWPQLKVGAH